VADRRSIVIVGAGIIGCAIARELASRGLACTVVDDRGVAGGATQASAGMLAPYVEAHERGPLLDLAVRSLQLFPGWIAALRRDAGVNVEYATPGTLEVAISPERADELKAESGGHARWLEPREVAIEYPQLQPSLGGRFTAAHGYVVPGQLANALVQAAERHGASFRAARVERVSRLRDAFRLETTTGALAADSVVLAAGAWTNGIAGVATPPVKPIRGQIVQLAWPGRPLAAILWGPQCYVVPRLDRTILVGATAEDVGYDERTTAAGIGDLLWAVCALVPEARAASFIGARVGLRPVTPDALPVMGEDPAMPGLFHASGHFRNGVLLAPITAKLIGDLVVDGRRDPALDSLRADRFAT
jgi:glycine oxidase ThiO